MKATPKSCSCKQCRALRSAHREQRLIDERRFRHSQNQALRTLREDALVPAGFGGMAA